MTDTAVHLTLFSAPKRLTKRIFLEPDGTIGKEAAALARAQARQVDVDGPAGLAHLLDGLDANQALAYGVTRRLTANIGPRDHLRPGEISRSRDNFAWHDGPGVLFLDLDGEHDADDVPTLQAQLNDALPGIADAPQVWARSSSAAIHNPETGETSRGGLHCYVIVANAKAVPAVGQRLYDGLWLNGHGRHDLSNGENPAALERCLVDQSVWQPERLDYAAPPVVEAPLERTAPSVISVLNADAAPLDPAGVKPLTDAQQADLTAIRHESKAKATGRVQRQRRALLDALPAEQRQQQRQRWLAMDRLTLTPDAPIILENGHTISAADILANPSTYNGQRCYDPQDPHDVNASSTQGRIYADEKGARVWSFAHGGRTFKVLPDAPEDARQAPENVLALAPEPSAGEVVGACYRHRAYASLNGLTLAADECGLTVERVESTWRQHLRNKTIRTHAAVEPTQTFARFEDVAAAFAKGESLYCLASLGSGKTRHLGKRVVSTARAQGRPVFTATTLRSLTGTNGELFNATHYRAGKPALDSASVVAGTIHSLTSESMAGFIEKLVSQRGVVILDEAAADARLLFESSDIMGSAQRQQTQHLLGRLAAAGVQFLLLDGDCTDTAAVLAGVCRARLVECTESEHDQPAVEVHTEQKIQKTTTMPCHADILSKLAAGERVVIATDGQKQAEQLHELYAGMAGTSLCIHGKNAAEPHQAAFLADPEAGARDYQLVIYSPSINVGVSVTSVEPHVYCVAAAGTLDAAGLWQLARRYRKAAGGVVRFIVRHNLCRPQSTPHGAFDIQQDIEAHARSLGAIPGTPEVRGLIAATIQNDVFNANPLHALVGHLLNIGLSVTVRQTSDTNGSDERSAAKRIVRERNISGIATAERLHPDEIDHFEANARATQEDQWRLRRNQIERGLLLDDDDFEGDDSLPLELVEKIEHERLESRVARLANLGLNRLQADLDEDAPGFAYMRHTEAQCNIIESILGEITTSNGFQYDGRQALEIANKYRSRIHHAYQDIPRPKRRCSQQTAARWLTDLLIAWGHDVADDRPRKNGKRPRIYHVTEDVSVSRFSGRFVVRHIRKSAEHRKPLEPAWLSA